LGVVAEELRRRPDRLAVLIHERFRLQFDFEFLEAVVRIGSGAAATRRGCEGLKRHVFTRTRRHHFG